MTVNYQSTRASGTAVSSAGAIARGISADGGLFVPCEIPRLQAAGFKALSKLDYIGRASAVLARFLTDYTAQELDESARAAYAGTFDEDRPAPLRRLREGVHMLELWHGPTCAFKDLALQLLPQLLTRAAAKTGGAEKIVILVATSGDTGKAALEGFRDVPGTEILVFYPVDGVSQTQKLQMVTQAGENVFVCAVQGNFDDAQTGVKKIFTDRSVSDRLAAHGMAFSSANSINWGRLVPQIVYYVSAYCDLLAQGEDLSGGFNAVVPTGNFGNILAAYYAKQMGVPIHRLVCASNANNVLTDFIRTGTYDRNRPFYTTASPSMDILISSNLERLLYDLSGRDDARVRSWMESLAKTGAYTVDDDVRTAISGLFYGGCCDDAQTRQTIHDLFARNGYLCDTHTAVAVHVFEQYRSDTGDGRPAVIVSTASPYKFASDVLTAVSPDTPVPATGIEAMQLLAQITSTQVPAPLAGLDTRAVRFDDVCAPGDMDNVVLGRLGL